MLWLDKLGLVDFGSPHFLPWLLLWLVEVKCIVGYLFLQVKSDALLSLLTHPALFSPLSLFSGCFPHFLASP